MNVDFAEISKQLLAFVLGLLSGLLVVYYRNYLENKRKFDVKVVYHPFGFGNEPRGYIALQATNMGKRPLTIIDAGFAKIGGRVWVSTWELPKRLLESEMVEYKYFLKYLSVPGFKFGWIELSTNEKYNFHLPDELAYNGELLNLSK